MKILDLSVLLNEQTPVYPGDPHIKIEPAGVLAKDGFQDHVVSLGTHIGTHIDAPAHMLEGGATIDTFGLEHFVGAGRIIDVRDGYKLDEIKQSGVQAGDIVLFRSDMSKKYANPEYFEDYPAIPKDVAEYLVKQKVKMVGVDTCSVDHEEFIAHETLLGGNVLIIENLANLDQLENTRFTVYALPLKLQLDGSPARVIAVID